MRHFPDGAQGQNYWYHYDGRGSVAGITKHRGQSTHNYRYDAFGQLLPAKGNWTDPHNHYLLTGKEWDEVMRLYYFGARYYDASAGVWLTQDTYRGQAEQPLSLHRTLYALANPVNDVDPYGRRVIADGYTGSGGGGGAVDPADPTPANPANPHNGPCEHVSEAFRRGIRRISSIGLSFSRFCVKHSR